MSSSAAKPRRWPTRPKSGGQGAACHATRRPGSSAPFQQGQAMSNPQQFSNYIDGEWTVSVTGRTFENRNPADSDDLVGLFQASSADDARQAVKAAAAAFEGWKKTPISKRAAIL